MNKISTGAFLTDVDASSKHNTLVSKLVSAWEKKNSKSARAGGVSLIALSLAACGSSDDDSDVVSYSQAQLDAATTAATAAAEAAAATAAAEAASAAAAAAATAAANAATAQAAAVAAAKAEAAAPETSNQAFVGTVGLDSFSGGTGNDTMSASNTTLNAGDSFAGGAGSDTLGVYSSAAATIGGFVVTDVETISVSSTSATATDIVTLNMGSVSGETGLQVTGSSSSVTFTSTDNIVPLTMSYNSSGNVIVTYNASAIVGTSDAMTVNTTDTANGTVNIAGIEALTVNNSGVSTIDVLTATGATTVNVTGSGTLTLTNVDDVMTTLSMTGYSGTSTVDGIGAVDTTITGGSGADTIKMGVTLTKADTIDGGDGADVLVVNNTDGNALTVMPASASVSNIETLRIEATDDSAADAFTYDASITSIPNIIVDASDENDTYTFTKITTENITLTESANNAVALLDVSLTDATGTADSLTVNVTNADAATALTVTDINSTGGGIETLNLVLNQGKDISGGSDIIIADVSSTHSSGVNITGAADATVGSGTAFANTILDASAATGDLTVTVGAASSTIKTGSGTDGVTFSAGALTTADTVNMGTGTDTLTTGNLAAGTMAAAVTGAETIKAEFGTASATLDGTNISGATTLTVVSASDENATITNLKAEVATVNLASNGSDNDAGTVGYVSTANAAHTINIGDDDKTADVDMGAITVTGNKGALTVNSVNFAGNSIHDLTANVATSLTMNTTKALELDSGGAGGGTLNAQKATTVDINVTGGALVVDGTQDLRVATTIDIDADQNTTLTGAMTATKATSLVVNAGVGAAFEQTGNFTSDADVTSVSLTAAGASATVRYNGVLDVDHVRTIDLVATGGGSVVVDDIELLGVESSATASDIDTALNITATGANGTTGSNVTVSAINVAAASTLDTVTITSDAGATVNFTTGAASLTITTFDATASLGTNVIDTSTSGAAVTLSMGAAKKNTITTELNQTDTITLSTSSSKDVYKILDDTTAVDKISNFKGGEGGDLVQVDVSELVGGTLTDFNSAVLTLANKVVMNTDANGVATAAEYTSNALNKEMNMLKLTDTFANVAAVAAAIDLNAGTELNNLTNNDGVLVLYTNGSDSFLASVLTNGNDGAAADNGADLVQFVGVTHSTLTADNFEFI